jgi:hypothetical protein
MASNHVVQTPPVPKLLPKLFRKWEYALGSPGDMPTMALDTDVGVLLFGSRNRTAASDQYPDHTSNGVAAPPMPCPAAEDAKPTLGSVSSPSLAGADRGQAIRPISP